MIPVGKLGDYCKIIAGQSPKSSSYNDKGNGMEFHQGKKSFGDNILDYSGVWTTEITKIAEKGDILMSVRAPVGPTNLTDRAVCIGRGLAAIRCSNKVLQQYVLYSLKNIQRFIVGKDGAVFNSINKEMIENLPLPITSLSEQQRIVDILDKEFEKIDRLKSNAELNLRHANDLFQAALKKELEPKEGWCIKHLNEVSSYAIGLTYKPNNVKERGTIVLRSSNIQNDELVLDDIVRVDCKIKEELYVRSGDILMCSRNGSRRLVGKVARIETTDERMTYGTFMTLIRSLYNPFLFYFFKSNLFKKQLETGENPMINQITKYMLNDVIVSLPPSIEEQNQIVATLDNLSDMCKVLQDNYNKTLSLCDDLKQSLLRKAFDGEL